MKSYKLLGLIAAMVFTFASCETEIIDPAGSRGEAVVPGIVDLNPAIFDSKDMDNTFVQFTIDLGTSKVDEALVLASYEGNLARVEVDKVTTFPATIKLELATVAAALGVKLADLELGDEFAFEIVTIKDGKKNFSSASFVAPLLCAYFPENVTGSYYAVSDDWGTEGSVTITVDPEDDYTVYLSGLATIDGEDEDKGPLKMTVDPLTFKVTAVKTVIASNFFGYHNVAFAGSGNLNTCDGTYTMMLAITVDEGSFGSFTYTFTRN